MAQKKRKISRTNASDSKKTSSSKTTQENEIKDVIIKTPLLVPSNEKLFCNYLMKPRLACKKEEKVPKVILPKIKIRCIPLNVEKIIDFENNKVVVNEIEKSKKQPEKNSRKIISVKTKTLKSVSKKNLINCDGNSLASGMLEEKTLKSSRKKLKKVNDCFVKKLSNSSVDDSENNKRIKISSSETQLTVENKSLSHNFSCVQQTNVKQQNLPMSTSVDFKQSSSDNLNSESINIQGLSNFSPCANFDEFSVIQLSDINLEKLPPTLKDISDEELKMKLTENENEINKITQDVVAEPNALLNPNDSSALCNKNQCDLDQVNYLKKTSLQAAVEAFMKNPQCNYLKENAALKKGLCFNWLSNNYVCFHQQCPYNHNALILFTKKLKYYPSKFIMTIVVSMRNDILFVDVIMAAFKILSERQIPMIWITLLVYFVFYVTEPSDSKFLKFWANSARFFCQSDKNYTAANGFASLLSIFSQGEKSEEWKIIEFIELIKQPPVQIPINYALLQPVLKMDLPSQFLTEAVEFSIATQKDVAKVFRVIVPKIPFMTSPIRVVELLLKFCQTLEEMNLKNYSNDLKQRLKIKILSFKIKVTQNDYPLTASFQEEINVNSCESNCSGNLSEELSRMDLDTSDLDNNYFKLEDNVCNLMAEAVDLSFNEILNPFTNATKLYKSGKTTESEEDICERQISHIRQFFHNCQFDLLGKYLNALGSNMIERAAKEFLKLSFKMKITLHQVVDLVKIIVLPCKSESATKIIASIAVTLILNLVRINEWKKAYTIVSLCEEKKINLVEGKVFYFNEYNIVSQCRIALLMIEIYAYKSNYASAIDLVKKYNLFSSNNSLWKLTWRTYDETIRIRILEDVLKQIISNQTTEEAYNLFEMIYKEQNQLLRPIDLRKIVNEILILLLNQDSNENAINLYEKIKTEVQLHETTVRAILITLIRHNRLTEAKSLLLLPNQNAYSVPEITTLNSITVVISSFWLEEEIYVVFDEFLDLLLSKKPDFIATDCNDLEIQIRISLPRKAPCSSLRPLCLAIIKPFFKDTCARIQRVLQYQFNPPLKLVISPYSLKLDEYSIKHHLCKRMSRNSS